LGTVPGGQSLIHQEYYAHGGNRFWPLMQSLLNQNGILDYEAKKQMLLNNGIALWDVIKECDRKSSKDSDIENEITNDFNLLLKKYSSIKKIIFNGHNPKAYFDIHVKPERPIELLVAKSTSPANNRNYSFEELQVIWKPLIK
jgi:TDG/mug DNA glycosylase family protein